MPNVEPWDRFSELGAYATDARQVRRPTAGGYSSRSMPRRVGKGASTLSRRPSAPGRFNVRIRGAPEATASRKCRRIVGYLVPLKPIGWTRVVRTQIAEALRLVA